MRPVTSRLTEREVNRLIPPRPKGLILLFHGAGGRGATFFAHVELVRFVREASRRGYALVALDSTDRAEKVWARDWPDNADLDAVRAALDALRDAGELPPGLPLYALGISNGGGFAPLAGSALGARAIALSKSYGLADVYQHVANALPPTLLLPAERDGLAPSRIVAELERRVRADDGEIRLLHLPPPPVTAALLGHADALDDDTSTRAITAWQAAGLLSPEGRPLVNPRTDIKAYLGPLRRALPDLTLAHLAPMQDLLMIAYGEHMFWSEEAGPILDWFDAHR